MQVALLRHLDAYKVFSGRVLSGTRRNSRTQEGGAAWVSHKALGGGLKKWVLGERLLELPCLDPPRCPVCLRRLMMMHTDAQTRDCARFKDNGRVGVSQRLNCSLWGNGRPSKSLIISADRGFC
jgi:hypothetical protein